MKAKVKHTGEVINVFTSPKNGQIFYSDGSKEYNWDELDMLPNIVKKEMSSTTRKVMQIQANTKISGSIK